SVITLLLTAMPLLAGIPAGLMPAAAASSVTPPTGVHSRHVCGIPAPHFAHSTALVVTADSGVPHASSSPRAGSYGPVQIHTAYNLPCSVGATTMQAICSVPASFGRQTVAVVDAYDDPTVENDLAVYDTQYGLPACTIANGCLTVINE